jgi:hypothetical protein
MNGYRLRVAFNDGVERDVDCAFLLHGTLGESLRDPKYFGKSESMTRHERRFGPTDLIRAEASTRRLRAGNPREDTPKRPR